MNSLYMILKNALKDIVDVTVKPNKYYKNKRFLPHTDTKTFLSSIFAINFITFVVIIEFISLYCFRKIFFLQSINSFYFTISLDINLLLYISFCLFILFIASSQLIISKIGGKSTFSDSLRVSVFSSTPVVLSSTHLFNLFIFPLYRPPYSCNPWLSSFLSSVFWNELPESVMAYLSLHFYGVLSCKSTKRIPSC